MQTCPPGPPRRRRVRGCSRGAPHPRGGDAGVSGTDLGRGGHWFAPRRGTTNAAFGGGTLRRCIVTAVRHSEVFRAGAVPAGPAPAKGSTLASTDRHSDRDGIVRWREAGRAAAGHLPLLLLAALVSACGGRHLRLVAPDTTAGPRYTCERGAAGVCQAAVVDVPEELNQSGTVFVILPRQCQGRVHQIVVLDAESSTPRVDVTCAPREEPLEEMSRVEPGAPGPAESNQ